MYSLKAVKPTDQELDELDQLKSSDGVLSDENEEESISGAESLAYDSPIHHNRKLMIDGVYESGY